MAIKSITEPYTGWAQNEIVTSPTIANDLDEFVYCAPAKDSEFPLTPDPTTVGHDADGAPIVPGHTSGLAEFKLFCRLIFTPIGSSKLNRAIRLFHSTSVRVLVGLLVQVLEGVRVFVNVRLFV